MDPIDTNAMLVVPGTAADLDRRAADDRIGLTDKAEGGEALDALIAELADLQNRLWAEAQRSILLVLQGLDTSGKDGTIRKVFTGVNPQGCRVQSFKVPTSIDLAHDYLWRVHAACPRRGEIGIFNRSHYEDVIAAPVLLGLSEERVSQRYGHINAFEQMLTDEGTTIIKCFLHISPDEQRERLQARLDDPEKRWKLAPADFESRQRWNAFMDAYEAALTATSTTDAPWYVIPADRKWVRDVAVASVLVEALRSLDPRIPDADPGLDDLTVF